MHNPLLETWFTASFRHRRITPQREKSFSDGVGIADNNQACTGTTFYNSTYCKARLENNWVLKKKKKKLSLINEAFPFHCTPRAQLKKKKKSGRLSPGCFGEEARRGRLWAPMLIDCYEQQLQGCSCQLSSRRECLGMGWCGTLW